MIIFALNILLQFNLDDGIFNNGTADQCRLTSKINKTDQSEVKRAQKRKIKVILYFHNKPRHEIIRLLLI